MAACPVTGPEVGKLTLGAKPQLTVVASQYDIRPGVLQRLCH